MRKIISILTVLLIIISLWLYIDKSPFWYYTGVIAIWFLFDNLSHYVKNNTTLDLLIKKDYKPFFKIYLTLLILSVIIEVIGSLILGLWIYPKLWALVPFWFLLVMNILGYLLYPIILISCIEMFNFFKYLTKNYFLAVISAMLVGIIIWEIPNIFSQDWIYQIPFITGEILRINIVVIIGWAILIIGPVYIKKILLKNDKKA